MEAFFEQNTRFLASQAVARLRGEDCGPGNGEHRVHCIDGRGYLMKRGEMTLGINFDIDQGIRRLSRTKTIHLRTLGNDGGLSNGTEV